MPETPFLSTVPSRSGDTCSESKTNYRLLAAYVCVFLAILFFSTDSALGFQVGYRQHPDYEQVELGMVQGKATPVMVPVVRRIGHRTVRIDVPRAWQGPAADPGFPSLAGSRLLAAILSDPDGLVIHTSTEAFGFIAKHAPDSGRLEIVFFPDPLGSRWKEVLALGTEASDPVVPERDHRADAKTPDQPIVKPFEPTRPSIGRETITDAQPVDKPLPVPVLDPAPPMSPDDGPQPHIQPQREQEVTPAEISVAEDATFPQQPQAIMQGDSDQPDASPIPIQDPGLAGGWSAPSTFRAPIVRQQRLERESPRDKADGLVLDDNAPQAGQNGSIPDPLPAAGQTDVPPQPERPEPAPTPFPAPGLPEDPGASHARLVAVARTAMANREYAEAVAALRTLSNLPDLTETVREEALYDLGDALFGLYQDDLAKNFTTIAQAYERAMNFNPQSRRTPLALRNIGVLHLSVNNLPEARAYFNLLRRDYPHDPLVPTTEFYLGQFLLDRGDYDQAANHFQVVLQNHPEHSIALPASIGLARALNAQGYDEQAFQIMEFLEKRWPRYYMDDPELLELAGIIALRINALDTAKQRMMSYFNLVPEAPDAHLLLARIGDLYVLTGKPDPARRIFEKTARMFPELEGGLIAEMRLVEGGIHDEPDLSDNFANRRAADVYSEIISKHPDSPLAAVATIKLAIWQVWNKRLEDSLMVVNDFLNAHPKHSLAPKALEVGMEAFSQLVQHYAADGRYPEILDQWNHNPFLHDHQQDLSPGTQLGLAMAHWNTGELEKAIILARPYLSEDTPKQLRVFALELLLGIFLEQQEWERIVEMARLREELPEPQQRELTYSLALALENLGRSAEAEPLWWEVAMDVELPAAQRGYAQYFLARTAMQEEHFERVYLHAQEALSHLLQESEDSGKIRDAVTWLTQVTERTGRLQEALAWALELDQLMDRSDPEWSMSRYRLAQLYQRAENHAEWRAVLEDLKLEDPRGLYGRLAASALQGRTLEDSAGRFQP